MEILQLPMMALQERIEQEMQENEALELIEEDPDLPEEEVETPNPDAPTPEERELVVDETKDNEADFERLLNMDEEWPDHFEERSRPSATRRTVPSDSSGAPAPRGTCRTARSSSRSASGSRPVAPQCWGGSRCSPAPKLPAR